MKPTINILHDANSKLKFDILAQKIVVSFVNMQRFETEDYYSRSPVKKETVSVWHEIPTRNELINFEVGKIEIER